MQPPNLEDSGSEATIPAPRRASSVKYDESVLRQRKPGSTQDKLKQAGKEKSNGDDEQSKEEVMWGKTPSGTGELIRCVTPPCHRLPSYLLFENV